MSFVFYDYKEESMKQRAEEIKHELSEKILSEGGKCLLLVDPTLKFMCEENELWNRMIEGNVCQVSFDHPELFGVLELWLIPVNLKYKEDIDFLYLSVDVALNEINPDALEKGKGRFICGWLSSPGDIKFIVEHISSTAIQKVAGEGEFLLRFFDAAIIGLVLNVLDEWQQSRLLGSIQRWYYIDGDGKLSSKKGSYTYSQQMSYSLSLNPQAWKLIQQIPKINSVLRRYRKEYQYQERFSEHKACLMLLTAFHSTPEGLLFNDDDSILFGMHTLTKHPFFYRHKVIENIFHKMKRDKNASYCLLVDKITSDDWNVIINECPSEKISK